MEFDCIIMNPPFCRDLHLKVLSEATNHLKTEDSQCVNLSPDNWLCNPFAGDQKTSTLKKFSGLKSKIKSVDQISGIEFATLFNLSEFGSLGLYECRKSGQDYTLNGYLLYPELDPVKLAEIIKRKCGQTLKDRLIKLEDQTTGNFVCANTISSRNLKDFSRRAVPVRIGKCYGPFVNGKYAGITPEQASKLKATNAVFGNWNCIQFETGRECRNFWNSLFTRAHQAICLYLCEPSQNVPFNRLPWLGDCVNPRTKIKGYESDWTSEDILEFLGIGETQLEEIISWLRKTYAGLLDPNPITVNNVTFRQHLEIHL